MQMIILHIVTVPNWLGLLSRLPALSKLKACWETHMAETQAARETRHSVLQHKDTHSMECGSGSFSAKHLMSLKPWRAR